MSDETLLRAALRDEARLAALWRVGLLDTPPEEVFDRLTRLAQRLLGAPVALVSLVDADRQWFASCPGLGDPWAEDRQTPLTHSFCQHVVLDRRPLVVSDAREHPVLRSNLAIRDLGVVAYAGVPLIDGEGHALGTLCVIDRVPRQLSATQREALQTLSQTVVKLLELRRLVTERR